MSGEVATYDKLIEAGWITPEMCERKVAAAKAEALCEAELAIRGLIAAHHHLSWEPPESCDLGPALEAVAALRAALDTAPVARAEVAEQRIAAALALADEWDKGVGQGSGHYLNPRIAVPRLRAALRGDDA